ncbi:hypothetical protein HPP92_005008 [Vanilla planifolia]|uniref:Uncharacterized protein n=1 Tax=Vanilla planifolia TaxID=51239 RepID=A0A835RNU1_VANPL|nr:hypothetical protein HPP92_005008 [Vanilla planifolia]
MAGASGNGTNATTTATAGATLKASAGDAAQSVIPKRMNDSLWWESFVELLEQLESTPPYSDISDNMIDKLRRNHAWFLDTVSCFKPPNEASRLALESHEICFGSHSLVIKPELKEVAFRASKYLCLDEVQMYILVSMIFEHNNSIAVSDGQKIQNLILLQYFIERQCLLKCVRWIFVKAIYVSSKTHKNNEIKREALQLIHDGLEARMLSTIKDLVSSVSSEKTFLDAEFIALWVDETIIEDNLILDVLFLAYYENFCVCNAVQWINLCSLFKNVLSGTYSIENIAVSGEAQALFAHVKAQLLFILIETLDLENLLHMVNEEVPFSDGGAMFSMLDIQEINSLVSSLSILGMVECGPLLLAWAVFICLISSLPDMKNNLILMEIDHVDYVHQAFEVRPFNYLLEVLRSSCLRDSDGPISGQLSILRTFVSAFIASYDFSHQPEKDLLSLILEMLCEIYHGEESLSIQFWDRDSFVDGPIRSLLYMLESEYPYRTVEFVCFLSALCNGSWSAQCVYSFLDKMHGMTLLFEVPSGSCCTGVYEIVKAHYRIPVPGLDGVFIPLGARGQILKFVDDNIALVRWECAHSGVYVLLLRMAQLSHSSGQDDMFPILNLLYCLISSNLALCFKLLHLDESMYAHAAQNSGFLEMNVCIDVLRVISLLAVRLIEDGRHVNAVGMCISLLAKMVECAPSLVIKSVLSSNIFGTANPKFSSGGLLFSGALFQILLADLWEEKECFVLTTSVLDYAIQHLEKGVLDVMKSCIRGVRISHMAGSLVWDILIFDSSVHNALFQLLLVANQVLEKTYGYHLSQIKEIDGLQAAACSSMDIICSLLTDMSKHGDGNTGCDRASLAFIGTIMSNILDDCQGLQSRSLGKMIAKGTISRHGISK